MDCQPDERAGELRGFASHFLRQYAPALWASGVPAGVLAFDFFFPQTGLFERGDHDREQVRGERRKVGLRVDGRDAIGPGFLLVERFLEHM